MLRYQQPLLAHRINKAFQEDATVMAINPVDYQFTFGVTHKLIGADLVMDTAQVAKALADLYGKSYPALNNITPSTSAQEIAKTLQQSEASYVLLGDIAMQHPHAAYLRQLVRIINELTNCKFGATTDGANSAGAWLAGAVPHREVAGKLLEKPGLDARALLTSDPVRAYLLLNVEPEFDTAYPAAALQALQDAGCVVCMTAFATSTMESYADFILPVAPFSETPGTFVNAEGMWQHFSAATVPHGEAKPAWKVLRVLANFLQLTDFDYDTSHQIHKEVKELIDQMPEYQGKAVQLAELPHLSAKFMRLAIPHHYRVDGLVRRAKALQSCISTNEQAVTMNQQTASAMGIAAGATQVQVMQGEQQLTLPLVIDGAVAEAVVVVPAALAATAGFGMAFGEVNCT